jgi:hypothetical protein
MNHDIKAKWISLLEDENLAFTSRWKLLAKAAGHVDSSHDRVSPYSKDMSIRLLGRTGIPEELIPKMLSVTGSNRYFAKWVSENL